MKGKKLHKETRESRASAVEPAAELKPGVLAHEEVLATGREAAAQLAKIFASAIPSLFAGDV